MYVVQKQTKEQTVFVSSSSESTRDNDICCLLNEFLINVTMKMIPTVPAFEIKEPANYLQNTVVSYPSEVFYQDHY